MGVRIQVSDTELDKPNIWCDQNCAFHSLAALNLAVIIELRLI